MKYNKPVIYKIIDEPTRQQFYLDFKPTKKQFKALCIKNFNLDERDFEEIMKNEDSIKLIKLNILSKKDCSYIYNK